jgi:nitroreductase
MHTFCERPLSELVRTRRATDAFTPEPMPDDDLEKILYACLEAPSSYSLQPWRFVVVRDAEQRIRLRAAAMNQQKVEDAPVVIVACGDALGWREDLEEIIRLGRVHDIGGDAWADRKRRNVIADSHPNISMWLTKQTMIAATTMMGMAEALGYDTGPMEGFDEEEVRTVLGIPTHVRVLLLLAVGHLRGEDGKYPGRLSRSRTVFAERYGRPFRFRKMTRLVKMI